MACPIHNCDFSNQGICGFLTKGTMEENQTKNDDIIYIIDQKKVERLLELMVIKHIMKKKI